MAWVLLTNDDGIDSPALLPIARALSRGHDVRIVVPDRERSWVGKAITRFDPVEVDRVQPDGVDVWTCSGFPADGVQLGVHALFDHPPRLVVSGINLGYNHGAGFLLSSGTVGAAMEARLSGIPAVAFSTGIMSGDYRAWRTYASSRAAHDGWARLASLCTSLLDGCETSGILDLADVVSINLPFDADERTPCRVTTVARVGYDRLFQRTHDGSFAHGYTGGFVRFDPLDGSDVEAAHRGRISITPLQLPTSVDVPDEVRRRLERDG
jgi:5'-nucleotidase